MFYRDHILTLKETNMAYLFWTGSLLPSHKGTVLHFIARDVRVQTLE